MRNDVGKPCGFGQASSGAGARSFKEEAAQSLGAKGDGEKGVRDMKIPEMSFSGNMPEKKTSFSPKKSNKPC